MEFLIFDSFWNWFQTWHHGHKRYFFSDCGSRSQLSLIAPHWTPRELLPLLEGQIPRVSKLSNQVQCIQYGSLFPPTASQAVTAIPRCNLPLPSDVINYIIDVYLDILTVVRLSIAYQVLQPYCHGKLFGNLMTCSCSNVNLRVSNTWPKRLNDLPPSSSKSYFW